MTNFGTKGIHTVLKSKLDKQVGICLPSLVGGEQRVKTNKHSIRKTKTGRSLKM